MVSESKERSFGDVLRSMRERRNLSLREVSCITGVDHAYLHCLEVGKKSCPRSMVLEAILRVLHATAADRAALGKAYGRAAAIKIGLPY